MRKRNTSNQRIAAIVVGIVALISIGLSLDHVAHGIFIVTQAKLWQAWAMAAVIDLSFIAFEVSHLMTLKSEVRKKISWWIHPAILILIVISAVLNAFSFSINVTDPMMWYAAVSLGAIIPVIIYIQTRVVSILWLMR